MLSFLKSFVLASPTDIKTLFSIGNELNVRVVADGISKKEDVIFLGGCGCVAVSGEYYSKPLPAKEYNLYVDGKLAYGRKETEFPVS